jgi:hypothetical protein
MTGMAKQPKKVSEKPKRNVVFITLDDATETALQHFIDAQPVKPERSAVGFTALVDFLKRQGFPVEPGKS